MRTDPYVDKDEMVARALRADPHQANRAIARAVNCADSHVRKLRARLTSEGVIPVVPPHPPRPASPEVVFAEPLPEATPRWRPLRPHGGPFSRLEAAELERDALFVEVQALRQEVAA